MAYDHPTSTLITVSGSFYGSTESWSFGLRCLLTDGNANVSAQAVADALATPTQTFFAVWANPNPLNTREMHAHRGQR